MYSNCYQYQFNADDECSATSCIVTELSKTIVIEESVVAAPKGPNLQASIIKYSLRRTGKCLEGHRALHG